MTKRYFFNWADIAIAVALGFCICMAMHSLANAQVVDDAHLRHICLTKQPGEQAACAGFIMGVIDTSSRPHQFCIQNEVMPEEVVNRVEGYIAKNPNNLPGTQQVTLALKAIWPCAGGQNTFIIPQLLIPQLRIPQMFIQTDPRCYYGGRRVC